MSLSWFFNSFTYVHHAAQPSTFRVASTEAVNYELNGGLPTCIFALLIMSLFVHYACFVLQCNPDVIFPSVILCWINPSWVLSPQSWDQIVAIVKPLSPGDDIWRHRTWSTLVQVMAFCLTAPSHYLYQYWLIISEVQWHSSSGNFTSDISTINRWNSLKIICLKFQISQGPVN